MFICNICNYEFKKKQSLQIHLNEKRCKSHLLDNLYLLHLYIGKLKNESSGDLYINTIKLSDTTKSSSYHDLDNKQTIHT